MVKILNRLKARLFLPVLAFALVGCVQGGGGATGSSKNAPSKNNSPTDTTTANTPPTITSAACTGSLLQGASYMCDVEARDAEFGSLTYSFGPATNCAWARIESSTGLIQGMPSDDQVGSCSLEVVVRDSGSKSVSSTYSVVVSNIAPSLAIASTSVAVDAPLAVVRSNADVAASDEGFGVYSLVAPTGTACSANGQLSINAANGEISYRPAAGFRTACNVKVRFDDGNAVNNIAESQFMITMSATNSGPVLAALACSAAVAQDASFTCTASATDIDGDPLTFRAAAGNTCAWATVSAAGVITGRPNDNQVGSCVLGVAVRDGLVEVSGTQTITVTNNRPTLAIAGAAIAEDAPLTVIRADADIQANEEGFGTYSLVAPAASACSTRGTVSINAMNGAVSYQPMPDFSGTCAIKVRFDDGNATNNIVEAEFQVAVSGVNDAPTINLAACPATIAQDANYSCVAAASDPEASALTYRIGTGHTCAWITAVAANGAIAGRPNDNQVGTCVLAVTVSDGAIERSATANITITNARPTLTIGNATIAEDSALTVIRADADVQANEEGFGTYSLIAPAATACSTKGAVSINATTGAVSYQPTTDFNGSCAVKVRFDDGNPTNNFVEVEFQVAVGDLNDAPTINLAACPLATAQDANYSCTAAASDPEASPLTYRIGTGHTCAWITAVGAGGAIAGRPNDNQVGTCVLVVTVSDGALERSAMANIVVSNVRPTLTIANANAAVAEDAALTVIRADTDVQASEEGFGTYSLVAPAATACSTRGTVSINAMNGAVSYQPMPDFNGNCAVKVRFDDGNPTNNFVEAEFQVTVSPVNDAPILNLAACPGTIAQDANYSCTATASDPEANALTYRIGTGHTCAWITAVGASGAIAGRPNDNQVGTCVLAVTVSDGALERNVTANITIMNVRPTLAISDAAVAQNAAAADIKSDIQVQASEEGFGTYSLITPTGTACSANGTLSINATTGAVRYQPTMGYTGTCATNVQFNDGNATNGTVNAQFNVVVAAPVIAPGSLDSDLAFKQTVYVITSARCVGCHGSTYSPLHASPTLATAHSAALTKVDFANIPNSRLATKIAGGHNCWSGNCTNDAKAMEDAIREWARIRKPDVVMPPIVDIPASFTCADANAPATERMRRLSDVEIQNTLRDLLGVTIYNQIAASLGLMPSDKLNKSVTEFSNSFSVAHINALLSIGEQVGTVVVGNATYKTQILGSCAGTLPISDACVTSIMNGFGAKVLRRPPTASEISGTLSLLGAAASRNDESLKTLILRVLLSPSFAFHVETGESVALYNGVSRMKLTQYEVANRISYGIMGSLPDDTLRAAAAAGQLATLAQVRAQAERLVATQGALDRLDQWADYWLHVSHIPEAAGSSAFVAPLSSLTGLRTNAVKELKLFLRHKILTAPASYPEMMLSRDLFPISTALGNLYGIAPIAETAPPVQGPPERAGLLTRAGLLFSGNDTTSPIQRGLFVRRRLLCDELPSPDPVIVAQRTSLPMLDHKFYSNRAVYTNFTTTAAACMGCHTKIDPLGYALEGYDGLGRPRTEERYFMDGMLAAVHALDTRVSPEIDPADGIVVDNALDLSMEIATSSKGTACFARQVFRFNKLRMETAADSCALKAAQDELTKNGGTGKMKDAVISNVANPQIFWRKLN